MPKKDVAVKENAGLPMEMDFEQDAGKGFENVGHDDLQTPFLIVLQKGSPEVDPDNTDRPCIEGAKTGMFMNSVTMELFDGDEGVLVVPCFYKRSFIEWAKREEGGGFQGEIFADDPILAETVRNEKGQDELPNGNIVSDTRAHYIIMLKPDGDMVPMIMSLSSTQIKKSKRWMTTMKTLKIKGKNGLFNPPMYSHIYKVKTVPESNSKGSWRGLEITLDKQVDMVALYIATKEMNEKAMSGLIKPAPVQEPAGEDVPF